MSLTVCALDKTSAKEGHDRHGDEVRRKQRDDNRQRQRRKEELADAEQHGNGKEDDHGGQGSGEHGKSNLPAALLGSNGRGIASFQMAEDVFEHNDRVVDEA